MRKRTTDYFAVPPPPAAPLSGTNDDPQRWASQLVHRRYIELVEPRRAGHYSVRIAHDGRWSYFPLNTADEPQAVRRAMEIHRLIVREGWEVAQHQHVREFTLALFWNDNPLLSTYTTLLTRLPASKKTGKEEAGPRLRIVIVERDPQLRRALTRWAAEIPGCACVGSFPALTSAVTKQAEPMADLILINRSQSDLPATRAEGHHANVLTIPFGIYESSDDIFISHTGLAYGYFLQRTHPHQVLAPIGRPRLGSKQARTNLLRRLRQYFQSLLEQNPVGSTPVKPTVLTSREEEILLRLSKGYPDKQIASTLNISSWTVHNHLKNIFRKLGVHTRTQAVIQYLQR